MMLIYSKLETDVSLYIYLVAIGMIYENNNKKKKNYVEVN
jgi:hypothetical protein